MSPFTQADWRQLRPVSLSGMVSTLKAKLFRESWNKKKVKWVLYEFLTRIRLQRQTGLACLEIRSRNEEAINSTRNMIYSLPPTVSTSILFLCFWIDLVRVLATTKNTSAVAGYARVQIHENSRASIPEKLHYIIAEIEKVIYTARHFNHRQK